MAEVTPEKRVMMPAYEALAIRELLLRLPGEAAAWSDMAHKAFSIGEVYTRIRASLGEVITSEGSYFVGPGCAAWWQSCDDPFIQPTIGPDIVHAVRGRMIEGADLVWSVCAAMLVHIKGLPGPFGVGGGQPVGLQRMYDDHMREWLATKGQFMEKWGPVARPTAVVKVPPKKEAVKLRKWTRYVPEPKHGGTLTNEEYNTEPCGFLLKDELCAYSVAPKGFELYVYVGYMDGHIVSGLAWSFAGISGGCSIGRRCGEFTTEAAAVLVRIEDAIRDMERWSTSDLVKFDIAKVLECLHDERQQMINDMEHKANPYAFRVYAGVKVLPYIGDGDSALGPWVWEAANNKEGTMKQWVISEILAPGWTVKDGGEKGPLLIAPKGRNPLAIEAQTRLVNPIRSYMKEGAKVVGSTGIGPIVEVPRTVTTKAIGPKLKKKLGFQGGDVLDDGTLIGDPTNALLELHDQVNTLPAKPKQALPASMPAMEVPPVQVARAHTLSELAAPFGKDRRQREVVKKRFRTLYGKLSALPEGERRAFLEYINTILQ